MSTIFVATPDGRQRELSVADFEAQWLTESLGDQAHYWKAGMDGWLPVTEYRAAPKPAYTPTAEPSSTSVLRLAENPAPTKLAEKISSLEPALPRREVIPMTFTKELGGLTKALVVFIWIHMATHLAFLAGSYAFMQVDKKGEDPVSLLVALFTFLSAIGYLLVLIVTAVLFFIWVHRAKANCEGFGAIGLQYSPGWAIGWFFVPFMNLVKPYDCMKETWRASTSPSSWMNVEPGKIVGAWWILWILFNMMSGAVGNFDIETMTAESLRVYALLVALSAGVTIGLTVVTAKMIWEIYQRQKLLVDNKEPMDLRPLGTVAGVPLSMYRQP